ncbi:hypothetical protein ACG98H_09920 [Corynebacterium sp. L4756]|uniref:hypothetical protein n=1 Tax=unclassified Corynebacterium TaxID=2624378 RepID=UPI00374D410D
MSDTPKEDTATSAIRYLPVIICVLGMLVAPYVVAIAAPAAAAGWVVIGVFAALTVACGLWFGAVTKPTWWFPVLIGFAFMLAKALYFQDNVTLYAFAFAILAGIGTLLTGANKLEDDEAAEEAEDKAHELGEEASRGNLDA